ncbi:MarR family transcriptional regulator [Bradyrhizobium elkanii]|uniref:MarR family transcriptional regulator n=1 Tax=Bradyrhizobium elkanii TaxID=29448 RepID=UPI00040D09BE|nr:helix-turn-helix domain-containing protein [Bradyrhizobium elkanii]
MKNKKARTATATVGHDQHIELSAYAAMAQFVLNFRRMNSQDPVFADEDVNLPASRGRALTLMVVRIATASQRTVTIAEIASQLGMPHSTVSGHVEWLEQKEAIRRRPDKRIEAAPFDIEALLEWLDILAADSNRLQAAINLLQTKIDREYPVGENGRKKKI